MSIQSPEIKPISKLLRTGPYYVPEYQRNYAWDAAEEVEDLWQDLLKVHRDGDRENHFLGQAVIHRSKENGKSKDMLIDGQQRLTTIVILLCVLRNKFKELSNNPKNSIAENEVGVLNIDYIGRLDEKTDKTVLKLGNNEDQEFFKKYIYKNDAPEEVLDVKKLKNKAHRRIIEAKYQLEKDLNAYLTGLSSEDKVEQLVELENTVLEELTILTISTDDLSEAYIVFETLNTRGKSLGVADLLKNYCFAQSGCFKEEVQNKWIDLAKTLKDYDLTDYIKCYWNASHKLVRTKGMYKEIVSKVYKAKDIKSFVNELSKYAPLYKTLQDPFENPGSYNDDIVQVYKSLNLLGFKTFYPLAMSLNIKNYDDKDALKVLKGIENIYVRDIIVAGLSPAEYERQFNDYANSLYEKKQSLSTVLKNIEKLSIKDEDFKNSFISFSSQKKDTVRYLLRNINNHMGTKEVFTNDDNDAVHIEHIMPQTPKKWGIKETNQQYEEHLNMLGNLTLLSSSINKKIKNDTFDNKKKEYEKSNIQLTTELLSYKKWDFNTIEERQKKLVDYALEIWKF